MAETSETYEQHVRPQPPTTIRNSVVGTASSTQNRNCPGNRYTPTGYTIVHQKTTWSHMAPNTWHTAGVLVIDLAPFGNFNSHIPPNLRKARREGYNNKYGIEFP